MALDETRELAIELIDIQQDMTIKLIVFGLMIVYAFGLWYFTNKMTLDSVIKILFKFFSRIYIYSLVFVAPLYSIMLFREYTAISLWTLLLQLYMVVFVITALLLLIFGWNKILWMFGLEFNMAEIMQEKRLKGESE